MKKLFIVLLFIPTIIFSQEPKNKSAKAEFEVKGLCEMCKTRIEKSTYTVSGLKYSNWDIPSNRLTVIYNNQKTSLDDIKKVIAEAGHDNDRFVATDEAYNNLHFCCKYRDEKD